MINSLKDPLSDLRQFPTTESPLKLIKNDFYFVLKTLFVLKIFTFLSWLFGHVGKRLIKEAKINFRMYDTWYAGQQIITIHIFPTTSRSKGKKVIRFGQLIEYNVRDIVLQRSCKKLGRETSSRTLFVF